MVLIRVQIPEANLKTYSSFGLGTRHPLGSQHIVKFFYDCYTLCGAQDLNLDLTLHRAC